MAKKDSYFNNAPESAIDPAVYTATEVGNIIDTQGYESALFSIQSGTLTTGDWTPKIEEGDDAALSDAADVDAAFLIGTLAGAKFEVTDDNTVKKVGYVGKKRYVRLTLTGANTPNGLIGAQAILGHPLHANIS